MDDTRFGLDGRRFARRYSQTSPFTDSPEQQAVQSALTGGTAEPPQRGGFGSPLQNALGQNSGSGGNANQVAISRGQSVPGGQAPVSAPPLQAPLPSAASPNTSPAPSVDYLSGFARRGGGTGGAWKGAAQGALGGALGGLATGGLSIAGGALYGGIKGAIQKHAASAPSDISTPDAQTAVRNAYRDINGQEISPEELNSAFAGGGSQWSGADGVLGMISNIRGNHDAVQAREAADRAAQPAQATADPMAATAPSAPSSGHYANLLNGFDPLKMNAEHAAKSPKYAFAMLAQDYPATPEGLQAMAQDPRFAAAGFQYVGKDKIMAPDPDNGGALGLVDVGLGFSAGGRGWQWGASVPGGAPTGAGGSSITQGQGSLNPNVGIGDAAGSRALLNQILAAFYTPSRIAVNSALSQ